MADAVGPRHWVARSLTTGKPYRGVNVWLLHIAALANAYESPWWATYHQIKERGGQIRRGEKATAVVLWKTYTKDEGTENERTAFVLRQYRVFNAQQADGLTVPTLAEPQAPQPIGSCEQVIYDFLGRGGPRLVETGLAAYYSPRLDLVTVPPPSAFASGAERAATLFHEFAHSTGHPSRLNRPGIADIEGHRFGDATYSREELVAEMGAAFLAGQTGIAAATLTNSAAYLASWIEALRGDHKLVVQAAAQAQRAADLVPGVSLDINGNAKERPAAPAVDVAGVQQRPTAAVEGFGR